MPVVAVIGAQWGDEGKGHIVDLLAEIVRVPSALIMRVEPPNIKVLVSSESTGNRPDRGCIGALANRSRIPNKLSTANGQPRTEIRVSPRGLLE